MLLETIDRYAWIFGSHVYFIALMRNLVGRFHRGIKRGFGDADEAPKKKLARPCTPQCGA